jgi:hypothetical protein
MAREWDKMMDDTPIYAAGLFHHPSYRWDYFKKHWNDHDLKSLSLAYPDQIAGCGRKNIKIH